MTLKDLIARFRVQSADKAEPQLWSDQEVTMWLNDAQKQACIRGRLLREDDERSVCVIPLRDGKNTYRLHPKAYEIINARFTRGGGTARYAKLVSREWLDANRGGWRDDSYEAEYIIQDDVTIRIVGKVNPDEALRIECYRLPMDDMEQLSDEPEMHEAHHEHLVHWALHKAFSVVDADGFDATKSARAEAAFTDYFGLMPDSDLRRMTRVDEVQHNYGVFP